MKQRRRRKIAYLPRMKRVGLRIGAMLMTGGLLATTQSAYAEEIGHSMREQTVQTVKEETPSVNISLLTGDMSVTDMSVTEPTSQKGQLSDQIKEELPEESSEAQPMEESSEAQPMKESSEAQPMEESLEAQSIDDSIEAEDIEKIEEIEGKKDKEKEEQTKKHSGRKKRELADAAHDPILDERFFTVESVVGEYEKESNYKEATQWVNVSLHLSDEIVGGDKIYFQAGIYREDGSFSVRSANSMKPMDITLDGIVVGRLEKGVHFENGESFILTFNQDIKSSQDKKIELKLPFYKHQTLYQVSDDANNQQLLTSTFKVNRISKAVDLNYYILLEKTTAPQTRPATTDKQPSSRYYLQFDIKQTPDLEKHLVVEKKESIVMYFQLSKDFVGSKELGVRLSRLNTLKSIY